MPHDAIPRVYQRCPGLKTPVQVVGTLIDALALSHLHLPPTLVDHAQ
jgi:hypothetical protein